MKAARVIGLGLLIAGCSTEPSAPATTDAPAGNGGAVVEPAQPATAAPAAGVAGAGGQSLTGSISGLSGVITGFEVRRTDTQTIVDLAADILFDFDLATLSPQAPQRLARAAELIRQGGAGTVIVTGHTDAKGDDAYNQTLSLARAKAVTTWLTGTGGVPADRLEAQGRGEAEPIAPNITPAGADDPAGRAKNRRVSLAIPR